MLFPTAACRPGSGRWCRTGFALSLLCLGLYACGAPDVPGATATVPELLSHAERRLEDGDLNEATASFRRALQKDSTSTQALTGLGRVYEARRDLERARWYRERAFHIDYVRGTAAREAGDLAGARAAFAAAGRSMPNHPMAPLHIGEIWLEEGRSDSAIFYLERAALANPRFADVRIKLGRAYLAAARVDDAKAAFEAAIEHNINAVEAYENLGGIHADRGQWAQAAANYEKALLIRPTSTVAQRGLERVRAQL